MRTHQRQLQWVHANRCRRRDPATAGSLMRTVAMDLRQVQARREKAERIVHETVDAEFREACRSWYSVGSTLVFQVSDPATVFTLRMRWADRLVKAFQRADLSPRVSKVVFELCND